MRGIGVVLTIVDITVAVGVSVFQVIDIVVVLAVAIEVADGDAVSVVDVAAASGGSADSHGATAGVVSASASDCSGCVIIVTDSACVDGGRGVGVIKLADAVSAAIFSTAPAVAASVVVSAV